MAVNNTITTNVNIFAYNANLNLTGSIHREFELRSNSTTELGTLSISTENLHWQMSQKQFIINIQPQVSISNEQIGQIGLEFDTKVQLKFSSDFKNLTITAGQNLNTRTACSQGHQWLAHGIIASLFIVMAIFELIVLCKIRQRLKKKPELFGLTNFSVFWKLGSSTLSRIDIYTDICFIAILRDCSTLYDQETDYTYGILYIICLISVVLSLIFPFLFQARLLIQALCNCKCCKRAYVLFPRMERLARLAYSSEYKGIASIIGSFCVDLKIKLCGTSRSVPRILSIYRLFVQDLVQATCQIIFTSMARQYNSFVLISILITGVSVLVSFANIFISTGAKVSRSLLEKDFPASAANYDHAHLIKQEREERDRGQNSIDRSSYELQLQQEPNKI